METEEDQTDWRCGRCWRSDPAEHLKGLVSWVQRDTCDRWYHTICVDWEELRFLLFFVCGGLVYLFILLIFICFILFISIFLFQECLLK